MLGRWVKGRPLAWLAVVWVMGTVAGSVLPPGALSWKTAVGAAAAAGMIALLALPYRAWLAGVLLFVAAAGYYQGYDSRNVSAIVPPTASESETERDDILAGEWTVAASGTIASRVEVDGDKVAFTMRVRSIAFADDPAGAKGDDGRDASVGEESADAREAADADGGTAENKSDASLDETIQVSIRLLEQQEQAVAAGWGRGDRIRLEGVLRTPSPSRNFGGFDYRLYLYRHHTHWQLSVKGLASVTAGNGDERLNDERAAGWADPSRLLRLNDDARYRLAGVFKQLFGEDSTDTGYLQSLVLGLTDDIEPGLYAQFSQLGLTHILAISGTHVAVFVAGCLWLLRLCRMTRERALVVTIAVIPLYIALTGSSPSAVRAGIMGMVGLYMVRRGLWKDAGNLIAFAAVAMLLWEPYYVYDVSFQLSFLVTLGLIVGVQRFGALLPIRQGAVSGLVSITIVAQLVSFPITVYYFNGLSLLSLLANFILVPFISLLVLPLGTFALLAGMIAIPLGAPLAWLVKPMNTATFWLIDAAATHDPLRLIWPKPTLIWIAAYYVLLWAVYAGVVRWKEHDRSALACAAVAGMVVLLWLGYDPHRFDRTGEVHVIDVGQGDAILVRTPQGRHMLIDGGGTISFRKPDEAWKERRDPYEVGKKLLVPLLKQRGVQEIELLVASHQDQDHIGGLQAVVEQIPVKKLLMNGTWKGNAYARKLFETAIAAGTKIVTAETGSAVHLDRHTELRALAAGGGRPLRLAESQNEESVVLWLRLYETTFLLTGDMTAANEEELLAALASQTMARAGGQSDTVLARTAAVASDSVAVELTKLSPVDVLKVAHHGSKTSTTEAWLAFWRPRVSVISAGVNNVYGHPNAGVLERLGRLGGDIRRTDLDGEVVFQVTAKGMCIRKMLNDAETGRLGCQRTEGT